MCHGFKCKKLWARFDVPHALHGHSLVSEMQPFDGVFQRRCCTIFAVLMQWCKKLQWRVLSYVSFCALHLDIITIYFICVLRMDNCDFHVNTKGHVGAAVQAVKAATAKMLKSEAAESNKEAFLFNPGISNTEKNNPVKVLHMRKSEPHNDWALPISTSAQLATYRFRGPGIAYVHAYILTFWKSQLCVSECVCT